MQFDFETEIIHWRGPAPFYFAVVPEEAGAAIRANAKALSYGWGVIPVTATIDAVVFTTSLFPKDGRYLLPLKDAVRRQLVIGDDMRVTVKMVVGGQSSA